MDEWRAERDRQRSSAAVNIWEESDVSDIDCTPTYDAAALDQKIQAAQQKHAQIARAEVPLAASLPTGASLQTAEKLSIPLPAHHIDVRAIAEEICEAAGVPIEWWVRRYMPAKQPPPDSVTATAVTTEAVSAAKREEYGPDMMRGEGEAMAAYVASGQRIPRRGEVGWTPEDIDRFEKSGFVMSGNRNRRITNVRIRKEAQVFSTEQHRALSLYNYEQREEREKRIALELENLLKRGQMQSG